MRDTNKAKPQETQHLTVCVCINYEERSRRGKDRAVNEERGGERNVQDVKVIRVMRDFVEDCIKFLGKGKKIKPLRRVFKFGCIFIFRTWIYRIPDSDCIFLLNIVMYINIYTVILKLIMNSVCLLNISLSDHYNCSCIKADNRDENKSVFI